MIRTRFMDHGSVYRFNVRLRLRVSVRVKVRVMGSD